MSDKIKIGISQGDVNGVGYEVILKAFEDSRLSEICTPIVYGSKKYAADYKKIFRAEHFNFNYIDTADQARSGKTNLIQCCDDTEDLSVGLPTAASGKAAYESLNAATDDLVAGKIDALVTAPINKKNIQSDDFDFPGHTEFLGQKDGGKKGLMFMISEKLKVGVVTGHIPLQEVASAITEDKIYDKLKVMNQSLKRDFAITKPKIAVLGLNPHAGDNGLLGTEEQEVIIGAIKKANEEKIFAQGPFPADGFFGSSQYLQYDAVLAMYHDQGLIPFKALSFGEGVNYTAGLSFVRTSPDHGTGYDIAGKGVADDSSLRQAVYAAVDIVRCRLFSDGVGENPLKSNQIKSFQSATRNRPSNNRSREKRPVKTEEKE